jgi:propionyl-CoA carboxylase alpha chain
MNTRLQVEHPVTECVTGLDLVRLQIRVAEGGPLGFSEPPATTGHAIEVRLYAEDPAHDWRPATGTLHRFAVPTDGGVRLDSGVLTGSAVTVHYDPMLAKVIAHAPTRAEAARLLAAGLARSEIHGVTTNRDLLVRVLRSDEFLDGGTDTAFLDRHPEVFVPLLSEEEGRRLAGLAAALAGAARRHDHAVLGSLPRGWRNVRSQPQVTTFESSWGQITVAYGDVDATVTPEAVTFEVDGVRREFRVHAVGDVSYVDSAAGSVALTEVPRFAPPESEREAGSLLAPMPGVVGQVEVEPGQAVNAGDLLMTLEAMKLEHRVHAPHAGTVTQLAVRAGSQVEAGTVLAVVTFEEGT